MQDAIEGLDAVRDVTLRVRIGGVLEVKVQERSPAVLWITATGVEALDATGVRVRPIEAGVPLPALRRIAGEGADDMVPQALELFAAAGPIADRIEGLVRIGERRWNVVLSGGAKILLPEEQPLAVFERVIALHMARDLLDRDIASVDMRLISRPTLRLNDGAMAELRHIKAIEMGSGQ